MRPIIATTVLSTCLAWSNLATAQYLHLIRDDNGTLLGADYAGSPEWLSSQKDPQSHLHAMKELKGLRLYLHDITLPEIRYVASLTQVRQLTLGQAPEKVGMAPGVLAIVAQCRHIETLSMCKSNLTNADCQTISLMANLKDLTIEGEDLCDAKDPHGLTAGAVDSLVKLRSLELLQIRGDVGLTDQDTEKLATLPSLKSLELRSRHLTDKALEIVASRMKLTRVQLESPHFTEDAIARLRSSKLIEEVQIRHYRP